MVEERLTDSAAHRLQYFGAIRNRIGEKVLPGFSDWLMHMTITFIVSQTSSR
jgi:hypothetical protein